MALHTNAGSELRSALAYVPARTALSYLVVGVLWIVLSDRAIEMVTSDPDSVARIQTLKGWIFVAVTAVAVYVVLARNLRLVLQSQAGHQQQAALLEAVISATTDAVFVKDLQGRYALLNTAAAAMLGGSREALLGRTDAELFSAADARRIRQNDQRVLDEGTTVTFEETVEIGGRMRVMMATKGVVRDGEGRILGVMGMSRDITQQRQMEERSSQSQKMEAIGRLAGGVAHDFNNMLLAIGGNADLLLLDIPEGDSARPLVEEIRRAVGRAADLTRRLLATTRQQPVQMRPVVLADLVAGMLPMLDRLLGDDVALVTHAPRGTGHTVADPSQVEQIILNLAVNARDAMADGGTLTIQVREGVTTSAAVAEPGRRYAVLEVNDDGVGMDDATRLRIFEPFFTTKELGSGTGLGLATVYAAVEQSGGFVEVESVPGDGTRFRVFLPEVEPAAADPALAPEPAASAPSAPVPDRAPVPSVETVLIVENDESVRRFAAAVLLRDGYRVIEAVDGEDALRVIQGGRQAPDVVLTDVMMPVLGGRALAEKLRALRPDLPVIFMTGFDPEIARGEEAGTCAGFLQKPFGPDVLRSAIRAALDRASAPRADASPARD